MENSPIQKEIAAISQAEAEGFLQSAIDFLRRDATTPPEEVRPHSVMHTVISTTLGGVMAGIAYSQRRLNNWKFHLPAVVAGASGAYAAGSAFFRHMNKSFTAEYIKNSADIDRFIQRIEQEPALKDQLVQHIMQHPPKEQESFYTPVPFVEQVAGEIIDFGRESGHLEYSNRYNAAQRQLK